VRCEPGGYRKATLIPDVPHSPLATLHSPLARRPPLFTHHCSWDCRSACSRISSGRITNFGIGACSRWHTFPQLPAPHQAPDTDVFSVIWNFARMNRKMLPMVGLDKSKWVALFLSDGFPRNRVAGSFRSAAQSGRRHAMTADPPPGAWPASRRCESQPWFAPRALRCRPSVQWAQV
jgi:hypothetical protein